MAIRVDTAMASVVPMMAQLKLKKFGKRRMWQLFHYYSFHEIVRWFGVSLFSGTAYLLGLASGIGGWVE
jgi:hypothetical protein